MEAITFTGAGQSFITPSIPAGREFNISIYGTFVATITISRSFDSGTTWLPIKQFTHNSEFDGTNHEAAIYKCEIETGNYTSGSAIVRFGY
jgi:hypothetical protein